MYSAEGETPVGQIRKQWSGIVKEYFTDADNFGITFPMDLDVNVKATLMAACFLIVSFISQFIETIKIFTSYLCFEQSMIHRIGRRENLQGESLVITLNQIEIDSD